MARFLKVVGDAQKPINLVRTIMREPDRPCIYLRDRKTVMSRFRCYADIPTQPFGQIPKDA